MTGRPINGQTEQTNIQAKVNEINKRISELVDEAWRIARPLTHRPMTEQTDDVMTDETRDEIVRLARKGWTVDQILDSMHKACPSGQQRWWTGEQVQQVIDEADREVERALTPTVPPTTIGLGQVYNEVYCARAYQATVEDAIMQLAKDHPEWMLDMSRGTGNWEEAND